MSYNVNNIFNKIIAGKAECRKILENESFLAFEDKFPKSRVHALIIPKGNWVGFHDFVECNDALRVGAFFNFVHLVVVKLGLLPSGYRLVMNSGADGRQEVPHFHCHVMGGELLSIAQ